MYFFRIEDNLIDATVCHTFSEKKAIEVIKRNCFKKQDAKLVSKISAEEYCQLVGLKKAYPVPGEIVELGIVKRYKILQQKGR